MQPQSRAFKASDTLLPVQLLKKKLLIVSWQNLSRYLFLEKLTKVFRLSAVI